MKKLVFLLWIVMAAPLAAQQPQPSATPADPLAKHLFPPELIMQRQTDIGLRDTQRDQISAELQKAQQTFMSVQWRIAAEAGKMDQLLQADVVNEAGVLAQADAILNLEREVKRTHLALLIRIRNLLTEEQRRRLTQLRGT